MFKRIGTVWIVVTGIFAGIFGLGCVVGLFIPVDAKLMLIEAILEKFGAILANSTTDWLLAVNVFINNLVVALIVLIFSLIPLLSLFIIFGNGIIIGVFLDLLWRVSYLEPGSFMAGTIGLLPHGAFELTAIFLAGSFGTTALLKLLFTNKIQPQQPRLQFLGYTVRYFFYVVVPLLLVAALVETFISPRIARFVQTWQTEQATSATLAVQLDTVALAQAGCIPGTTTGVTGGTDQMALLYDEVVYEQLRQRAKADRWLASYTCGETDLLLIASYDRSQWSPEQAEALLLDMVTDLQMTYRVYVTADKTIVVGQTDPTLQWLDDAKVIRYSR
ncbi:MAG: stage II sporulation protein M [Candidatus Kerfeldbacteria bacterium]|nr:stage II sporulation protein M [Candidatus Kerfeldbacteria bacterium]